MDLIKELSKIDWNYQHVSDGDAFIKNENLFKQSVTFKLINGSFKNPFLSDSDSDSDNEDLDKSASPAANKRNVAPIMDKQTNVVPVVGTDEKQQKKVLRKKNYVPGLRKLPLFPKRSALSEEEHKVCLATLRFMNNHCVTMPPVKYDAHAFNLYNELLPKIKLEQVEFNNFVKNEWLTSLCGRQVHMMPTMEKFIEDMWKQRLAKIKNYPPHYKLLSPIPLVYANTNNPIETVFLQNIQPAHDVPEIRNITLGPFFLPCRDKGINAAFYNGDLKDSKKDYTMAVSEDPLCEQYAIRYKANVVISSSGLKNIADNQAPYARSWDIPVCVKEFQHYDAQGKVTIQKVVFINRALPPRVLTGRQKSNWCFKLLLKAILAAKTQNNKQQNHMEKMEVEVQKGFCKECILFSQNYKKRQLGHVIEDNPLRSGNESDSDGDDLVIDEACIPVLDNTTQGVTTRGMAKKLSESQLKKPSDSSCKNEDKLVKQVAQNPQETNLNLQIAVKCTCGTGVESKSNDENIEKLIAEILCQQEQNSAHDSKKIQKNNLTYNLWKIGQTEHESKLSKTAEDDITVLVRCRINGCERTGDSIQHFEFAPKLEYQLEFGAEAITPSEAARQWTALKFRPQSKLIRARLNPDSGEILMLENLSLQALTNEAAKLISWRPQTALGCLFNVFTSLSKLNPGQYLLRHDPKQFAFAMVYSFVPNSCENGVDLYKSYDIDPSAVLINQKAPWTPLDPSLVTPSLAHRNLLPCMFYPGKAELRKKTEKEIREDNKALFNKKKKNKMKKKRRCLKMKEIAQKKDAE